MKFLNIKQENEEYLNSDDALYHYTKSNIALEFILKNMQLRFSKLDNFKDPKENFFHSPPGVMWGENVDIRHVNNNFEQEVNNLKTKIRIACFCTNTQLNCTQNLGHKVKILFLESIRQHIIKCRI